MGVISVHAGRAAIDALEWDTLTAGALDRSRRYLGFQAFVHGTAPVVVAAVDDRGLCAGVHGIVTAPWSPMLASPWKMLASSQFLRLDAIDGDPASEVRARHASLLRRAVQGANSDRALPTSGRGPANYGGSRTAKVPGEAATGWLSLARALGEALVVRGFDTSEVHFRADVDAFQRERILGELVGTLKSLVRNGSSGAIAFPLVDPADRRLRAALERSGFCCGILTAATEFDLDGYHSYEDLLAAASSRRRRKFRIEQAGLGTAGAYSTTLDLAAQTQRIVELETATTRRHGGSPDIDRLLAARRRMADQLGANVRVPAAIRPDGTIIACGVHLFDTGSYYCATYGCDYNISHRGTAYQCVSFYDPLEFAISRAIPRLRLGFEAFEPKLLRGAVLRPRELWLWTPGRHSMTALAELLDFLSARSSGYLAAVSRRYHPLTFRR